MKGVEIDDIDILSGFGSDLFSGHRIIRVKSWDDWKKLQIPSNCEMNKKSMTEADSKMYKELLEAYADGMTKLESLKKAYWVM